MLGGSRLPSASSAAAAKMRFEAKLERQLDALSRMILSSVQTEARLLAPDAMAVTRGPSFDDSATPPIFFSDSGAVVAQQAGAATALIAVPMPPMVSTPGRALLLSPRGGATGSLGRAVPPSPGNPLSNILSSVFTHPAM